MTAKLTFSTAEDSPRHVRQVFAAGIRIGMVQRFGGLPSCQRRVGVDVLAAWQQAGDQP